MAAIVMAPTRPAGYLSVGDNRARTGVQTLDHGSELTGATRMRVLIATDAWYPTPQDFRSVPLPSYPEIRLALCRPARVARAIVRMQPTHFHIPTEPRSATLDRNASIALALCRPINHVLPIVRRPIT